MHADDDWFDDLLPPVRTLSVVSDSAETGEEPDWFSGPEPAPGGSMPPPPPAPSRRRVPLRGLRLPGFPLAMALVATAGLAVIAVAVLLAHGRADAPAEPDAHAAAPSAAAPARPWCANLAAADPVPENPSEPGLAAIAAFERAYYSGLPNAAGSARAHVAPDARVGTVEELAAGIATVPAGTTHCLLSRGVAPGIWAVELFARRPSGELDHYPQTISTVAADTAPQRALITAIIPRGDS